MKKIVLILISFFLFSCGSRQKKIIKESENTNIASESSFTQNSNSKTDFKAVTDLSSFFLDKSLKITPNGTPYQFQYGNLIFSGSAGIELSKKNEKIIYRYINVIHTTYQTYTNYKTYWTYKSLYSKKNLDVKRSRISFGSLIFIIIVSGIAGAVLWSLIKSKLSIRKK